VVCSFFLKPFEYRSKSPTVERAPPRLMTPKANGLNNPLTTAVPNTKFGGQRQLRIDSQVRDLHVGQPSAHEGSPKRVPTLVHKAHQKSKRQKKDDNKQNRFYNAD
jgi:hypothetical protein